MSHRDLGHARESLLHVEVPLVSSVGRLLELSFVGLHVLDKVYEVARLAELLKVLSVDNVSEFILYSDDQLNRVQLVEAVVLEGRVESN